MSYIWNLPTKVLFGPGMLQKLGDEKLPGKKALLVISNGKSVRENGALEQTQQQLSKAGCEYVLYDQIQANPTVENMTGGIETARENGCDFVVGLGGGSVLDAVTVIAAVVPQKEGVLWDFVPGGSGGKKELSEPSLPYVEITTSAGTGSEVDAWGVVTNTKTKEKIGFKGAMPTLAVVDPELMLSVPPNFTAYQGFDALFHSVEGFISNVRNEAGDMFQLTAVKALGKYLPLAVHQGDNLEARTQVAFANTMSGYSMEVCSCSSEHALEHALSGHHDNLPHGAGLVMLSLAYYGHFIKEHACDDRFIALARALGVCDACRPEDFLVALKKLEEDCGVGDLKMSDFGITEDELETIAKDARYTMTGLYAVDPAPLTDEDALEILRKSFK
ncbi:MAG: iron-containing alcohol dehydrogenase [Clostridia bacterium]|nr:iron-containing alcohol dehydrogenase [Clostridia bacterium]